MSEHLIIQALNESRMDTEIEIVEEDLDIVSGIELLEGSETSNEADIARGIEILKEHFDDPDGEFEGLFEAKGPNLMLLPGWKNPSIAKKCRIDVKNKKFTWVKDPGLMAKFFRNAATPVSFTWTTKSGPYYKPENKSKNGMAYYFYGTVYVKWNHVGKDFVARYEVAYGIQTFTYLDIRKRNTASGKLMFIIAPLESYGSVKGDKKGAYFESMAAIPSLSGHVDMDTLDDIGPVEAGAERLISATWDKFYAYIEKSSKDMGKFFFKHYNDKEEYDELMLQRKRAKNRARQRQFKNGTNSKAILAKNKNVSSPKNSKQNKPGEQMQLGI